MGEQFTHWPRGSQAGQVSAAQVRSKCGVEGDHREPVEVSHHQRRNGVALDVPIGLRPPMGQALIGWPNPTSHHNNRDLVESARASLLEKSQVGIRPMATTVALRSMLCAIRSNAEPGGDGCAATGSRQYRSWSGRPPIVRPVVRETAAPAATGISANRPTRGSTPNSRRGVPRGRPWL